MRLSPLAAAFAALAFASTAYAHADEGQAAHHAMGLPAMPSLFNGQADRPGAPVFTNLGAHRMAVTTTNPQSQVFFDQGVNLLFAFNHAEAIRSFREAARLDPACAMCWWGVAYALGPNINMPMPDDAVAPALFAAEKARHAAHNVSPKERAWIAALSTRYGPVGSDRAALDAAYAKAMGELWAAYPDDMDVGTFYAEALMDTQPWAYWEADQMTPKGHGAEILKTLETVMARAPEHPGALHLYIHAAEASLQPERAEAAADRLAPLMPQAGHIVHMPSHIYYRVGRYADAAAANELAAKVDEDYIAACRAQGFYPAGYYGHNIHFLWTASEMEGRYEAALNAANRLVKAVDAPVMAKDLPPGELYLFTPITTQLRFGRYDEVLAAPAPDAALPLARAMWHYAQGFAHANKGDFAAAATNRALLAAINAGNFDRYTPFGVPGKEMTDVALASLDGEIARLTGDLPGAIAHFRRAAVIERALPYMEPAYWHRPVSHLLGATLLQAGKADEAEAVYRDSLRHYRRDGWALYGLAQALTAQGKTAEAAAVTADFQQAWSRADTKLTQSRL
ncbi:MAG TPA: tetratricopeptide repeat protein [Caulobacteraceae bacterium]|nr:tetratricopeptide repeat protein [Caulobacteraceae bacterium]